MKLINQHIEELRKRCDRHHVSELYVFGSVAKEKNTDKSDIDFLYKFLEYGKNQRQGYQNHYYYS